MSSIDPIAQVINQFRQQGGDPANLAPTQQPQNVNLNIPIGGSQYQFSSPEEAGNMIGQTFNKFQEEIQRLQQERDAATALAQQASQRGVTEAPSPQKNPIEDPNVFAQKFLDSPVKAIAEAMQATPEYQTREKELSELRGQVAVNSFMERHSVYKNPLIYNQFSNLVEQTRQKFNQPLTPEGLEASYALAVQSGVIPDEQTMAQRLTQHYYMQQQQQPTNGMPQNYGQPQGQQFAPPPSQQFQQNPYMPPPQYGNQSVAPPPSPGRAPNQGGMGDPSSQFLLDEFNRLSIKDQAAALQAMQNRGIGG